MCVHIYFILISKITEREVKHRTAASDSVCCKKVTSNSLGQISFHNFSGEFFFLSPTIALQCVYVCKRGSLRARLTFFVGR